MFLHRVLIHCGDWTFVSKHFVFCYDLLRECFVTADLFKESHSNVDSIFLVLFGYQKGTNFSAKCHGRPYKDPTSPYSLSVRRGIVLTRALIFLMQWRWLRWMSFLVDGYLQLIDNRFWIVHNYFFFLKKKKKLINIMWNLWWQLKLKKNFE